MLIAIALAIFPNGRCEGNVRERRLNGHMIEQIGIRKTKTTGKSPFRSAVSGSTANKSLKEGRHRSQG